MTPSRPAELSDLQASILLFALSLYERVEVGGNPHAKGQLEVWGIRWQPAKQHSLSRVATAAVSRAVARLERRGLVIRNNQLSEPSRDGLGYSRQTLDRPPPRRSTHLILTAQGRLIAEQLKAGG